MRKVETWIDVLIILFIELISIIMFEVLDAWVKIEIWVCCEIVWFDKNMFIVGRRGIIGIHTINSCTINLYLFVKWNVKIFLRFKKLGTIFLISMQYYAPTKKCSFSLHSKIS